MVDFILGYIVTQNRAEIKMGNVKIPVCVRWSGRTEEKTPAAALPHVRTQRCCERSSAGGTVALPDRGRSPNRPDGADRAGFPSVRLTFSPVRFPCLKYGIANDEGVSSVVFIEFC